MRKQKKILTLRNNVGKVKVFQAFTQTIILSLKT